MTRRLRSFPRLAAAVAALVVMPLGLVTAGSPAAADGPAQSDRQTIDFTAGWRFALANRDRHRVPPEYADAVRRIRRLGLAVSTCRTTGASSSTRARAGDDGGNRVLRRRARVVPQDVHRAARPSRQEDLDRVRRRVHEFRGVLNGSWSAPTRTATRASRSTSPTVRHTDGARQHRRRQGPEPAAEQPLVLGQWHLPQRPSGHHRTGPRGRVGTFVTTPDVASTSSVDTSTSRVDRCGQRG